MALFSRRSLQRCINENARILSRKQLRKHVKELNEVKETGTLAFEWEVVLVNVFSKLGDVRHELSLGNGKDADIAFNLDSGSANRFVADITTVSDKGLDIKNPIEFFQDEFSGFIRRTGLSFGSFEIKIGETEHTDPGKGIKIELRLPGLARFGDVIFNSQFNQFIESIKSDPQSPRNLVLRNADVDIWIQFKPNDRYTSISSRNYTEVFRLTENTVYGALTSKASKIDGVDTDYPYGILLCDGGCDFFTYRPRYRSSYSIDDVIRHFLELHPKVNFVMTFSSIPKPPNFIAGYYPRDEFIHEIKIYSGTKQMDSSEMDLKGLLGTAANLLPKPLNIAKNALRSLRGPDPTYVRSRWLAWVPTYEANKMTIKISARALLELLAGRVTQEQFFESHGFTSAQTRNLIRENPFESALKSGKLLKTATIVNKDDEIDDDWIEFELESDAAIGSFTVPTKQ